MIRDSQPRPSDATVQVLIAAASRSPSSHNTQPWIFQVKGACIELWADRSRALPVNDPSDRELFMSCGAALHTLEVAARHIGMDPQVSVHVGASNPDHVADVLLRPGSDCKSDGQFDAIDTRRTIRAPFTDDPVPEGLLARIRQIAEGHGVHLLSVGPGTRDDLADLVSRADEAQFADPEWRRELAQWLHPYRRGDGLRSPPPTTLMTKTVVTAFDLGKPAGRKDRSLVASAPEIVVLATERDDAATWVVTGRALQHVLLVAASEGVQAGYLNQPCQVTTMRGELQELVSHPYTPQAVLRLGVARRAPRPVSRRPVAEIVRASRDL